MALVAFVTVALTVAVMAQQKSDEKVVCPVSGETVLKSQAVSAVYEGKTYYFCCEGCKAKFLKDPKAYLQKASETKDVYTCPMHPEVQSDQPGKCPKCGMNLEKKAMPMAHGQGGMKMMQGQTCPLMDMTTLKDVEIVSENLKDGVMIRITAKDPETVKKIQEMGAKVKPMHEHK